MAITRKQSDKHRESNPAMPMPMPMPQPQKKAKHFIASNDASDLPLPFNGTNANNVSIIPGRSNIVPQTRSQTYQFRKDNELYPIVDGMPRYGFVDRLPKPTNHISKKKRKVSPETLNRNVRPDEVVAGLLENEKKKVKTSSVLSKDMSVRETRDAVDRLLDGSLLASKKAGLLTSPQHAVVPVLYEPLPEMKMANLDVEVPPQHVVLPVLYEPLPEKKMANLDVEVPPLTDLNRCSSIMSFFDPRDLINDYNSETFFATPSTWQKNVVEQSSSAPPSHYPMQDSTEVATFSSLKKAIEDKGSTEHLRLLAETKALLAAEKEKTLALQEVISSLGKAIRDQREKRMTSPESNYAPLVNSTSVQEANEDEQEDKVVVTTNHEVLERDETESHKTSPEKDHLTLVNSTSVQEADQDGQEDKVGTTAVVVPTPLTNKGRKAWWIREWKAMYDECKRFYEQNGHCCIPTGKESGSLGNWVKAVRKCHSCFRRGKKTQLTGDLIQALDDIEFCWTAKFYKGNLSYKKAKNAKDLNKGKGKYEKDKKRKDQIWSSLTNKHVEVLEAMKEHK